MRKFLPFALLAIIFSTISFSCGNKEEAKELPQEKIDSLVSATTVELPNYRYVDLDTIVFYYNLAKDYNEEILRMQNNLQNEMKKQENSLQSMATSMQNKLQNNIYLTQASYEADQKQFAEQQNKAQKTLSNLQSNFESKAIMAQKTVNDSIEAFIQNYNKDKGYDAIFIKNATLYINPALDITQEVITGLNERYNKVKK